MFCAPERVRTWTWRTALAAAFVAVAMSPVTATGRDANPGDDWCAAANALAPGAELRLAPGDYVGPCTIRTGGAPGAPIVIRGASPDARPRLVFAGIRDNVLTI